MEYLTMTNKELNRHAIIRKLLDKEINGTIAANLLKLSVRQVKRLKVRVKDFGAKGLIHKSRGKPSNRAMPQEERKTISDILKEKYPDFKPTFAAEKLKQNHKIDRDPKTIRAIMTENGLWHPKKKKRIEYHAWRKRKDCYGQMLQFDGSYHRWAEDRAGEWCLLAAIDDATGIPVKAKFDTDEGVFSVFKFWKEYAEERGKPRSIYLDKFSTYKMNQKAAMENHETQTQFQRAMGQLGIEPITAHSPQAKGRIERLFNTLQDRLVKEMRLREIKTQEEANQFVEEYLPIFNKKFNVLARGKGNMHMKLPRGTKLSRILCIKNQRSLRNDFTVAHNKKLYQVVDNIKTKNVMVEESVNGSLKLYYKDKSLKYKEILTRPSRLKEIKLSDLPIVIPKKKWIPAPDHPWRRLSFRGSINFAGSNSKP